MPVIILVIDRQYACSVALIPAYKQSASLRVIESYQAPAFAPSELGKMYDQSYTVSALSDRMGVRLEGTAIEAPTSGIVSEGLALGAIQLPPDGMPIVLLNDRQTLGGYPKLGCVARVDLPKLAQLRQGAEVSFTPVSLEKARAEWVEFCQFFVR